MNCAQIEELLPLYAGHDLSTRREQTVTAHLQTCAGCSLAAAEYRDMHGLMRDFASPVFGEEVYAEIRKNVWERIESQPQAASIFESIAAWFQPRLAWAAATALMIIVSFVGLYFVVKEFKVQPVVIVEVPKVVPAFAPAPEVRGGVSSHPDEGTLKQRQANVPKRLRKPDRMVAPDRGNSLVAFSPDVETTTIQASAPIVGTDNLDLAAPISDKTLRMEIQTRNPNIRIIWFSQREPKPVTVNSKGI